MARLTGSNIEAYRSGSGGGKRKYLTLKDDGDIARGRILCEKAEDIECYVVHRVKVGDYEREVNCLYDQENGGSAEDCPFCQANIQKAAKVYIPFFNEDANEIQVFERPNRYYSKIANYCARYAPLVANVVEIERRGKAKDTKTDYDIFPVGSADGTTVQDVLDDCGVDELPKIIGGYVLNKTADEMEYYINNGEFPDADATPVRRRDRRSDEPSDLPFEVKDEPQKNERSPRRRF